MDLHLYEIIYMYIIEYERARKILDKVFSE